MDDETMKSAADLASRASVLTLAAEKRIGELITVYAEMVALAEDEAGADRLGDAAMAAHELQEIRHKFAAAMASIHAAHCQASRLQARILGAPLPQAGER